MSSWFGGLAEKAKQAALDAAAEAAKLSEDVAGSDLLAKAKQAASDLQEGASAFAQGVLDEGVDPSSGALSFDFEFAEGPLGFKLGFDDSGAFVVNVDPNGQAAQHGVSVGDRLYAIAGSKIPFPQGPVLEEERADKVKALTKQIRDCSRPLTLTFGFADASQPAPPGNDGAASGEQEDVVPSAKEGSSSQADNAADASAEAGAGWETSGWETSDWDDVELTLEDEKTAAVIDPKPDDTQISLLSDVSPIASPSHAIANTKTSTVETSLPEPATEDLDIGAASAEMAPKDLQRLHDDLAKRFNDLQTEHSSTKSILAQIRKEQSAAVDSSEAALKEGNHRAAAAEKTLALVRSDFEKFRAEAKQQQEAADLELKQATERLATATANNRHQQELAEANMQENQKQRDDLSRQLEELQAEHDTAKLVLAKLKDDSGDAAGPEKRTDPADGMQRTLEELKAFYEGTYSPQEVDDYWGDCTLVKRECGTGAEGIALEEANARATVAEKALEDLRATYDKARSASAEEISKLKESVAQQQETAAEAADSKCKLDAKVVELMKSVEVRKANEAEMEAKLVEQSEAMEALASKEAELKQRLNQQSSGQAAREADLEAKLAEQMKLMEVQAAKEASLEAKLAEQSKAMKALAGREAELKDKLEGQSSGRAAKEAELEAKLAERIKAIDAYSKKESELVAKVAELSGMLETQATKATAVEAQLADQKNAVEALQADLAKKNQAMESLAGKETEMKKNQGAKEAELLATLAEKDQAHAQMRTDLEGQLKELSQRLKAQANKEAELEMKLQGQNEAMEVLAGREAELKQRLDGQSVGQAAKEKALEAKAAELSETITTQKAAATALEAQLVEQKKAVEAHVAKEASLQAELAKRNQSMEVLAGKEAEMKESFNSKEAKFVATLAEKERAHSQKQAELESRLAEMGHRFEATQQRDNRANTAHAFLENRVQTLQEQIRKKDEEKAQSDTLQKAEKGKLDTMSIEIQSLQMRCRTQEEQIAAQEEQILVMAPLQVDLKDAREKLEHSAIQMREMEADHKQSIEKVEEAKERALQQRSALEKDLAELRAGSEADTEASDLKTKLANAQEEIGSWQQRFEVLGRTLRQQLTEQQEQAASELEEQQLEFQRRVQALESQFAEVPSLADKHAEKSLQPSPSEIEDAKANAIESQKEEAPEKAGQEETLALQGRIDLLERRCLTLQNKLSSRPIIYQSHAAEGQDPLMLESGSKTTESKQLSLARRLLEQLLRKFTQRLLKRDAWLFMFYAHLVVLYAISGSCLSHSRPAANCVEMTMKQGSAPSHLR